MDEYDDMWSDLGEDLLGTVCEALTIPDIYSFASVCRSWRSAAALKDKRRHLHRFKLQKPWLVFSESDMKTATFANFYSISDGRFLAMGKEPDVLPSLNNCFVIGSDHGWMIVADERSELSLVNPMTRKQIALPPVSTFDIVIPQYGDYNKKSIVTSYCVKETEYNRYGHNFTTYVYEYTVENLRYSLYWKACLSSSPAGSDDDYTVVVLLHNQFSGLALAKSGDEKWTMMFDVLKPLFIVDMVFQHHRRRRCSNHATDPELVLLTTNESGMVQEWDLSSQAVAGRKGEEFLPADPELDSNDYFFYLVHTPRGDLLQVRRLRGEKGVPYCDYTTFKIEVYRVDFIPGSQKRRLVKVKSLGHHALFVGGNTPVCVSTVDAPALKPNCVYFTDEYSEFSQYEKEGRRDIGIYNLEDGTIQHVLPNDTRLLWPPPLWFTPSLL